VQFRHCGELKPAKLFLEIAYAHLPGLTENWYAVDKLLKETLDALETTLACNAKLEEMLGQQHAVILDMKEYRRLKDECFKANLKHQDELAEKIKFWKTQSEMYKKLFLMGAKDDKPVE
jgi:hypothetical protein